MPAVQESQGSNRAWEMTKVVLRTAAVTAIAYRTIQFFRDSHLIPAQTAAKEAGRFFKLATFKLPPTGYKVADMVRGAAIFHPLVTTASVTTGWLGLEALFQAGSKPAAPKVTLQVSSEEMYPALTVSNITVPEVKVEKLRGVLGKLYTDLEEGRLPADKADLTFACIMIALHDGVVNHAGPTVRGLSGERIADLRQFADDYSLGDIVSWLDGEKYVEHVTLAVGEEYGTAADSLTVTQRQFDRLPEAVQGLRDVRMSMDALESCILWLLGKGDRALCFRHKKTPIIEEAKAFAREHELAEFQDYLEKEEYKVHTKVAFHGGDLTMDVEGLKLPEGMRGALADHEKLNADIEAGRLEYPLPVVHDCLKVLLAGPATDAYREACLVLKRRYPEGSAISTPTRNPGKDLPDRAAFAEHYQLDATFWSAAKFREMRAAGDDGAAQLEVKVGTVTDCASTPLTLTQEDHGKLPENIQEAITENRFGGGYPELTVRFALEWLIADNTEGVEARWKQANRDIGEEMFGDLFDALNEGNKLFKAFGLTEGPDWAGIGIYCCPQLRVEVKEGVHTKGLFKPNTFLLEASEAPRTLTLSAAMMGGLEDRAPNLHAAIDEGAFRGLDPAILNNCLALVLDKAPGLPDSARGKSLIACIEDDRRAYKDSLQHHKEFAQAFKLQNLALFFDEQLLAIHDLEQVDEDLDWR
jgi:hypothetical protein